MAPIDLNKNKANIVKAHKEVSDPNSKTNWALFGYEGQTDVLKFVSQGDGGIEELVEELSSGKILYAYIKVIDGNTNLPKFVFINWQGEGVPEVRKGACANHVRDVQNLLRGAHVSINARTEEDVDEDTIQVKVSKASGANYSFHKEASKPMPKVEPVGSVYEKVRPQIEIKPDIREKFWEASEKEEKQRILLEKQRQQQERTKLDREAKEREEKETKVREQREADRLKNIRQVREAEKQAADADRRADQTGWDPSEAQRDEEERSKRSEQMRKERAAEAKALVSGRTTGARAVFEQKPTSQFDEPNRAPAPAPTRKLKQPAFLETSNQPVERKQPIQLPKENPPSPVSPVQPVRSPPASQPQEELYEDVAGVHNEPEEEYDDVSAYQPAPASSGPQVRNLLAEGMPRRPASDDEQEEEQNWEEDEPVSPPQSRPYVAEPEEEELYQDSVMPQQAEEELYQDTAGQGVCARALYDYQAAEDNEITFDPDDIVTNIEMIDEGWWIGNGPDGTRGMFPANYVELI